MVVHDEEYPNFPKLGCSACEERFDVPRKWVNIPALGNQIIVDWIAAELFMKEHHQEHNNDLISGIENLLREDAQHRGR